MLCVTGKKDNDFLVLDTDDGVTESVSKEGLLITVFNLNVPIYGVSKKYIEIYHTNKNEDIIHDFFVLMKKVDSIATRESNNSEGTAAIRYWGTWEVPDDAEDEEDYDWKVLSPSYRKKLNEISKILRDKYKDVNISLCVGEKCWIDLTISPIRYIV